MKAYETSRLILRGLTVKESDLLLDYLLRNKNFLQEWEPLRDDSFYSLASVKRMIENEKASSENKSSLQGKMTEALTRLIDIAFSEYKLHRIEANIIPRNIRSQKVLQKLSFVEEGLSPKYLKINGKWEDHFHYVLLNEEAE